MRRVKIKDETTKGRRWARWKGRELKLIAHISFALVRRVVDFPVALKMTYFCPACRLFDQTSQVTTTPNLMVYTLVEPSVARPTHTGEDCNEPWRELGAAGSGAGSRLVSPLAVTTGAPKPFCDEFCRKTRTKKSRTDTIVSRTPELWKWDANFIFFNRWWYSS